APCARFCRGRQRFASRNRAGRTSPAPARRYPATKGSWILVFNDITAALFFHSPAGRSLWARPVTPVTSVVSQSLTENAGCDGNSAGGARGRGGRWRLGPAVGGRGAIGAGGEDGGCTQGADSRACGSRIHRRRPGGTGSHPGCPRPHRISRRPLSACPTL